MLFRRKMERACIHCIHGTQLDDEQILCVKKGLQAPDGKCRRFKYDPCKRIPKKARALDFSRYKEEDFSL